MSRIKRAFIPWELVKNTLFAIFIVIIFFGAIEGVTRLFFTTNPILAINIGAYRQYHPTRGFSLKPNYRSIINSYGFLGSEFQIVPKKDKVRIIVIGDSVSFNPIKKNYPRVLENELNQFLGNNSVEVICAAVPGYSSYQALTWFNEFLYKLKADITIIYLGWNDMGQFHPFGLRYKNENLYREKTLLGTLMQYFYFMRLPYYFIGRYERSLPVDLSPLNREETTILENFAPTHYEKNLQSIIRQSQEQKSLIYLISLTSLLSYPPTEEELRIMHFPRNTKKKLSLYKAIHGKYVKSLERVATFTQSPIIDLDKIIETPEQRTIFTDTMHINQEGAEKFGKYIADSIKHAVLKVRKRKG